MNVGQLMRLVRGGIAPPPQRPAVVTQPTIVGSPTEDITLTSVDAIWANGPILSRTRQWYWSATGVGGWSAISGATAASYTPGSDMVGRWLRLGEIAVNETGASDEAYSDAVGPVADGEVPVLQNYTMRRGARTKANAGSVDLEQFMLASGGGVSGWSITLASGTTGHWNMPTDGTCPTPTTAGDNAELNGGPYVFNVTATNDAGASNVAQLTINAIADVYTVATPSEFVYLQTATDNGTAVRPNLGGRTIELAKGSDAAFLAAEVKLRSFNTHTGTFEVTSEDQTEPVSARRFYFDGGNARIKFHHLRLNRYLEPSGPDIGDPPIGGNPQNEAMVYVAYSATRGNNVDITFEDMWMGATAEQAPYTSQWCTAVSCLGQTVSPYDPATGFTFRRVTIERVKDGLRVGRAANFLFEDVTVDRFCSNGVFVSGDDGHVFRNVVSCRPCINRTDPSDHRDFNQIGGPLPVMDVENFEFDGLYCIQADGTSGSQGPFFDDIAYYKKAVTGFTQNNHKLSRVFYDGAAPQGLWMDGGSDWDVQQCTIVRGEVASTVSLNLVTGAILPPVFGKPLFQGNDYVASTGSADGNAVLYVNANVTGGAFPDFLANNAVLSSLATPPSSWNVSSSNDQSDRIAFMSNFFQDPGRVIDYPNLTAREILAEIRLAYAPIVDGPLKRSDGSYHGAFMPDGSDNDGSVYTP